MVFDVLATEGVQNLINSIEPQLLLLSEAEQNFVVGCRMTLEMGGLLTQQNQDELRRIAGTLNHAGHNVLGGVTAGDTLSMQKVVKDLVGANLTLNPQEKQIVNQMLVKIQRGQKLDRGEVAQLLRVYFDKGF
jgi:hypothetical protein